MGVEKGLQNERIPAWSEIASSLRDDLTNREWRFVHAFYRAQVRRAQGKEDKAKSVFDGLKKQPDYVPFEDSHATLLEGIRDRIKPPVRSKKF